MVTRTGSRWKVLANRRTASGHVALTDRKFTTNLFVDILVELTHHRLPLSFRLCLFNDPPDIILESFVKHPICLVQDEIFYTGNPGAYV